MAFSSYALQYSNVDVQEVIDNETDLFITEGGPLTDFANSAITAEELATLQAGGTTVAGYINASVTDDSRGYWDSTWTDDGTDTGTLTDAAPDWLIDQPSNEFGYIVDFTNSDWQDLVIEQAVDLVSSGFNGVFIDDFAQYIVDGVTDLTANEAATEMMEFAVRINDAITAVDPDAVLVTNGDPYVVTNAVGGATSDASVSFLDALDGMLLESYYGINLNLEEAIEQAKEYIGPSADLLALEFGGTTYQNYLFEQQTEDDGALAFYSSDASYSDFGEAANATSGDDDLLGTSLDDRINAYAGDDIIDAGDGNDVVAGNAGADAMDGGEGNDYLNYNASSEGVSVDLSTGTGTGGDAEGDTFTGFERIIGSSYDDTLTGDENMNVFRGGAGADQLDGAGGIDYATYANSSEAVTIDLETGTGTGGDAEGDTLANIERVIGSDFDDVLTGDAANNLLVGRDGSDTVDGGAGTDIAVYWATQDNFTFENTAEGEWTVTDTVTGDIDTLSDIETLRFSDGTVDDAFLI